MNGKWVEIRNSELPPKLELKDGEFEHSRGFKGTYTIEQGTIVLKTTHVFNPDKFDDWIPVAKTKNPHFYSDWVGACSGDKIVFGTSTYKKEQ